MTHTDTCFLYESVEHINKQKREADGRRECPVTGYARRESGFKKTV